MERDTLLYFRDVLQIQLDQLQIRRIKVPLDLEIHIDDQDPKDEADLAAMRTAREWAYRMENRKSRLLREIHAALQRIHDGEFGTCDHCGDDIDVERLRANPWTKLCIGCKRNQEATACRKVA